MLQVCVTKTLRLTPASARDRLAQLHNNNANISYLLRAISQTAVKSCSWQAAKARAASFRHWTKTRLSCKAISIEGEVARSWLKGSGTTLPGPQKYVNYWPLRPCLVALGYYFTYFWGPGRNSSLILDLATLLSSGELSNSTSPAVGALPHVNVGPRGEVRQPILPWQPSCLY